MRARLLSPERVTIQPVDRAGTRVDELGAEPYAHQARGATLVILAQVDELTRNRRQPGQGGGNPVDRVALTFLVKGYQRADGAWTGVGESGWVPASGDRISRLAEGDGTAGRGVAWYVTDAKRIGKDGTTAKLIEVSAETRAPRRASTEGL